MKTLKLKKKREFLQSISLSSESSIYLLFLTQVLGICVYLFSLLSLDFSTDPNPNLTFSTRQYKVYSHEKHFCLFYLSQLPLLEFIPHFYVSNLKCQTKSVVWFVVLHLYGNIFSSLPSTLFLSFFLEVSS